MKDEREKTWYERIFEQMPSSIDRTLIVEALRLTPTERLLKAQALHDFAHQFRVKAKR